MAFPQQPFPPAPTPKKKSKWPWIVGGFVGLTLIACGSAIASGGDDTAPTEAADVATTTGAATKTEKAEKKDETPGLGQAAKDGKFQFTVTGVKCGATKVGSDFLNQKAQGQFCLIDLTIKNIGKEAQTFLDSEQKAYDAKKVEYSVDSAAAMYANGDNQILFQEINPGNTVKGKLVFDVPKGTKLTELDLHDSMFSGGVKVALR
ncbi:DUF4352 domain-containing protein [Actinoplanes sp. L3-i22]|uniref:DUF4352 domain-containing protein n=1 Tax=Actinoplanes sp. L3-i22 TaxID=2836373 RepID=UPI001C771FEC|nr:DUF4352 domain-containing protein [Actinoplanes sp. L3-i22]BCY13186.1 Mpr protein [Actinoplanes sp. L3-i22]